MNDVQGIPYRFEYFGRCRVLYASARCVGYDITAAGHALSGKDSVRIADGTFIKQQDQT